RLERNVPGHTPAERDTGLLVYAGAGQVKVVGAAAVVDRQRRWTDFDDLRLQRDRALRADRRGERGRCDGADREPPIHDARVGRALETVLPIREGDSPHDVLLAADVRRLLDPRAVKAEVVRLRKVVDLDVVGA